MSNIFCNFVLDFALMGTNNPNIVSLKKLRLGRYEFDYQLDNAYFAALEKTEILSGSVSVHAALTLREEDYDLRLKANGVVQVACDRCLDPMDVAVDVEEAIDPEEGGEELDIPWLAYELISVNLPLVHCHQEGGCNPAMDALLQDHLCADEPEGEEQDNS